MKNDDDDDVLMDGPLIRSIERDQTVAPEVTEPTIPLIEVEDENNDVRGNSREENAQNMREYTVKRIVGEKIGPNMHEFRVMERLRGCRLDTGAQLLLS